MKPGFSNFGFHSRRLFPVACLLLWLSLCFCCMASAEYYEGTTTALESTVLTGECAATISQLEVKAGSAVDEGDLLLCYAQTGVFADTEGTVASVSAQSGDTAEGEILKLAPASLYLIYCSTDKGYDSPENALLHSGETLYIQCTKNGSHRAIGIVGQIDGEEYQVETIGGALYIGETVYLYRSDQFAYSSRVGIGTVVSADPISYEADGIITEMLVSPGDYAEKGQLLFRYLPDGGGDVLAPAKGIISEVFVSPGDKVQEGTKLLQLVQYSDIGIKITADEKQAARLQPGMSCTYTLAMDPGGTEHYATITQVGSISTVEGYTVLLRPEEPIEYLGMSVQVCIE